MQDIYFIPEQNPSLHYLSCPPQLHYLAILLPSLKGRPVQPNEVASCHPVSEKRKRENSVNTHLTCHFPDTFDLAYLPLPCKVLFTKTTIGDKSVEKIVEKDYILQIVFS